MRKSSSSSARARTTCCWTAKRGNPWPRFEWRSRYWSFLLKLHPGEGSPTIQGQPGPWVGPFHWESRRLRVAELKRLMTFPDDLSWSEDAVSNSFSLGMLSRRCSREVIARMASPWSWRTVACPRAQRRRWRRNLLSVGITIPCLELGLVLRARARLAESDRRCPRSWLCSRPPHRGVPFQELRRCSRHRSARRRPRPSSRCPLRQGKAGPSAYSMRGVSKVLVERRRLRLPPGRTRRSR